MPDLQTEREHLAKADSDIADGKRRITAQSLLAERLRADGRDTSDAERLLLTLRQTLEAWQGHRELIVRAIERLERGTQAPINVPVLPCRVLAASAAPRQAAPQPLPAGPFPTVLLQAATRG